MQHKARYICPITMKEMNGHYKFCVIWSCGCVLSEQALREIPGSACLQCGKTFTSDDIVDLNPKSEDLEAAREAMKKRVQRIKEKRMMNRPIPSGKRKAETLDEAVVSSKASVLPSPIVAATATTIPTSIQSRLPSINSDTIRSSVPKIIQAKRTSEAIRSLYVNDKNIEKNSNWLTKGTFTRYTA